MSRGDGRGPGNTGLGHNGGQASGSVNGGPTGMGGRGSNSANSGAGWTTTTDPGGWTVHHYTGGNSNGVSQSGNGGSANRGGENNSSYGLAMLPGIPAVAGVINGEWGIAVSNTSIVAEAVESALTALKTFSPLRFGLWGIVIAGFMPTKIAPDDPTMMAHIVTSLPADRVTSTPISMLPTQPAALVHTRLGDVIQGDKQHIAAMGYPGVTTSIPSIAAKPTKTPGVFAASIVPGMPDIHLSVITKPGLEQRQSQGVINERGNIASMGFTAGQNTHDAIIHFPPESKTHPIYVSVATVLTDEQIKKQKQEENRRQLEWDIRHPVEVAQRKQQATQNALNAAKADVQAKKKIVDEYNADRDQAAYIHQQLSSLSPAWKDATDKAFEKFYDDERKAKLALANAITYENEKAQEVKDAEQGVEQEKNKEKGKKRKLNFDQKIRDDMQERGWSEEDIRNIVDNGASGISVDQRRPIKTEDAKGRNDPATVYGGPGKYVVVNDRTDEVCQVSGKKDLNWIDDSRIKWGK